MTRPLLAVALLASAAMARAQVPAGNSAPQPAPFTTVIPAPQDIAYPGVIQLDVDATDTDRGIFRVKEQIPVAKTGHTVLLFPKWLPGAHSPRGEVEKLAGLVIRANGKVVPWTRDPVDMFAFHLDVPGGARRLDAEFQFISATKSDQGAVVVSPSLIRLQPNSVSLYPAGYFTRQIPVQMTVKFPTGFSAASALPSKAQGSTYAYQQTNYEILVDSPILAGRYYKQWQLTPRVFLDTFADTPAELTATPAQVEAHKRLAEQAIKTFGAQHYDNYHFLLSISDQIGGIGLEHHRSSEDGTGLGYFTEPEGKIGARNLLPHEYTHSWDGKFRRGADLWTPNFDVPMRDSLLWVYEGQTQFWGYILQARSGLDSKQDVLDELAASIAPYAVNPARQWRPLIDTTNDPIISARRPKGWTSWQRSEDYYVEGAMVWMEVDARLRQLSGGAKSIDDFARAFFGVRDGDWGELTYTFDDVARTLNAIQPYDWAGLLRQRLTETAQPAPTTGFAMNGYTLVFTAEPTGYFKSNEKARKTTDLSYSIGLATNSEGSITSVRWDGPAFRQGLTVGTDIVAVNGQAYSGDALKIAILAAQTDKAPIRLVTRDGKAVRDVAIDYHDGPRYPRFQKTGTGETGLDRLLAPR